MQAVTSCDKALAIKPRLDQSALIASTINGPRAEEAEHTALCLVFIKRWQFFLALLLPPAAQFEDASVFLADEIGSETVTRYSSRRFIGSQQRHLFGRIKPVGRAGDAVECRAVKERDHDGKPSVKCRPVVVRPIRADFGAKRPAVA